MNIIKYAGHDMYSDETEQLKRTQQKCGLIDNLKIVSVSFNSFQSFSVLEILSSCTSGGRGKVLGPTHARLSAVAGF